MEEYDDTYYAPQITSQGETRTLTFQTRILNQHLICTLCMGYFDEACTIIECLHTFCRSCVMRHFRDSSFCPQCEKNLGPNPVDHVRTDRTLQSIVEKVFPQFSRQPGSAARASGPPEEEEAEPPDAPAADAAEPPRKRGRAAGSGAGPSDAGGESGAGARSERVIGEEISFSLHELEGSATATTPLEKPYLRTKSALTVGHLRKCVHPYPPTPPHACTCAYALTRQSPRRAAHRYLSRKMSLPPEVQIAFYCAEKSLESNLTLAHIATSIWAEDEDLVLHYRLG